MSNGINRFAPALRSVASLALTLGALGACGDDETSGTKIDSETSTADSILVPDTVMPDTTTATETTPDTSEPDTAPPQPGEFGYACDENIDCNSGWCVQTADGRQCTRSCIDSCPSGYDCRLAPGTDATFICLPRFLHLCDPCRETSECNEGQGAGNYCLAYGEGGRFCGVACEDDPDCPGGYVCRNVPVGGGAEAKQCVPEDGGQCTCSAYAKQAQRATTCFVENDHGKCEGTRFCLQSGLSSCDAATPFPESCNQLDDNCNGQKDEFPPDYACELENEFGTCKGKGTCVDGQETCIGDMPAPDICDLKDNDCDGETDNGLCDDLNPCTTDSCNPETGDCIHVPDDTRLCDDGSMCTQVDKCTGGVCTGYNPLTCGDGNQCKTWTCDPIVGCLSSFNTNPCEDGNPCTVEDKCNQGVCVSGGPNLCNDNNACTDDSCEPGVGCKNQMDDLNTCNIPGIAQCKQPKCQAGQCIAINKDSVGCTTGSGDCPQGTCQGGTCRVNLPQTCNYDPDLCETDVPGTCSANGDCIPTSQPSCQCSGPCAGICVCCQIGPIPLAICIPF